MTTSAGCFAATALRARLPRNAWQRLRAGHGTKGDRHYDWAMIDAGPDDTLPGQDPGHSVLLVRRHGRGGDALIKYGPNSATRRHSGTIQALFRHSSAVT